LACGAKFSGTTGQRWSSAAKKINVRPIGAVTELGLAVRNWVDGDDPYRLVADALGGRPAASAVTITDDKGRRRGRRPPQGRCRDRPCTRPGAGVSGAHSQLTIAALAFAAGFGLHGIAVAEIGTGLVFGYVGLRILRPRGNRTSNIDAGQAHWRRTTA